MKQSLDNLIEIFNSFPEIKLVYFFGSKANSTDGPLSDYDFAIYLEEKDTIKASDLKFRLQNKISRKLVTDKIDIAVLNINGSPEFKYNVIKNGELIFEREPYRVLVEPRILNEYFDFMYGIRKYGLTRT